MKKSDYVSYLAKWIDGNTDMLPSKSITDVPTRTLMAWENGHRREKNWRKLISSTRNGSTFTVWECSMSLIDQSVIYMVVSNGENLLDVFTGSHKYFSEYFGKSLCQQ